MRSTADILLQEEITIPMRDNYIDKNYFLTEIGIGRVISSTENYDTNTIKLKLAYKGPGSIEAFFLMIKKDEVVYDLANYLR